jgi:hydroxyethylthiazole kinase-like uncharacterized protein yjeF
MKLVSVPQMLEIEKQADASGLTYERMMENAGTGLAEAIQGLDLTTAPRTVAGLVGPGNNGGDTLVALALLAKSGWAVHAYLIKRRSDALLDRLRRAGGQVALHADDRDFGKLHGMLASVSVLLDGVLGTGTKPPLRGEPSEVLAAVGKWLDSSIASPLVVAVDCPSGVDCETGAVADESLPADITVTMAAVKRGLLKSPAYELLGDLRVVGIGLPDDLAALETVPTDVADESIVAACLPSRPMDAHKGTFGTAMVVAGSVNYTGAAYLAGKAAYRAGAGLVTLAVAAPLHSALAGQLPEATWILLPHEVGVISSDAVPVLEAGLRSATAALIGPGLGMEATTGDFLSRLLAMMAGTPHGSKRIGFVGTDDGKRAEEPSAWPGLVFDADGLKLLKHIENWHAMLPGTTVLTPHPGEMAVLTGRPTAEIQADRENVASRFAKEWGHVVVLKGAFTVVGAPDGRRTVIPVATPALARAGTGDVLAGVITGLRAQGVPAYEAAVAGAWIHGEAGLRAARDLGTTASVLAGDVLSHIADVLADF